LNEARSTQHAARRTSPGFWLVPVLAAIALFACSQAAAAQSVTHRGFADVRAIVFPEDAPNDAQNLVLDVLVREEVFAAPAPWLQLAAGAELRVNTHDQVDEEWGIDISDRTPRRPPLSIRRLTATLHRGPLVVDAGKQFIRWGKTDIVTPTDRFAPRDYACVFDSEFLAVAGVRGVIANASDSLDVVWVPRFTPSRIPHPERRWTVLPGDLQAAVVFDEEATRYPEGSQFGLRWNRTGGGLEWSLSFFDGFNHLPAIEPQPPDPTAPPTVLLAKRFPALRMFGGDLALPTRWFTLKAEGAYFDGQGSTTDDYVLYVVQLERQTGEWLIIAGYAGEAVTRRRTERTFAPDRGTARSVIGRASYTIDAARSLAFEGAVRENGDGAYGKAEYSEARGDHWRWTVTGTAIAGRDDDFIGQYHRNSHVTASIRYSF
jgi:hypothetical protein